MSRDIAMQSSNLGKFTLKNVVVLIIIIVIIVDHICMSSCVVRLQLLTQEALVIKPGSDVRIVCIEIESERMRERKSWKRARERESRVRERD